jgi:hypothetical protein
MTLVFGKCWVRISAETPEIQAEALNGFPELLQANAQMLPHSTVASFRILYSSLSILFWGSLYFSLTIQGKYLDVASLHCRFLPNPLQFIKHSILRFLCTSSQPFKANTWMLPHLFHCGFLPNPLQFIKHPILRFFCTFPQPHQANDWIVPQLRHYRFLSSPLQTYSSTLLPANIVVK